MRCARFHLGYVRQILKKSAKECVEASACRIRRGVEVGSKKNFREKIYNGSRGEGNVQECCYCYMFKPKLEVSDKMYRCKNERCKKVYPRDPGAAKNNK